MARILSAAIAASIFLACGSTPGNGDGGTSGATGGTSGGCPAVTPTAKPASGYCNGVQAQTGACTNVYIANYPESDDVRNGCATTFVDLGDAGFSVAKMGGILDRSSYSSTGLLTLFPSGCEDFGQGSAPVISATAITPPSGAATVAATRTAAAVSGSVYGIVTYVDGPYYDTTTAAGKDALLYLQDQPTGGTPAPLSGVSVYIDDVYTTGSGTNGYPDGGLTRGAVVSISGLTWSPYDGQDQLAWSTSAQLTVLGTQPLPPAISLSASDMAGAKGAQYLGMRVTQSDAPDKVVDPCPAGLQSGG